VFRKDRMFYDQWKQKSKIPKAWNDKKQDKENQRKKGFQPVPFRNMVKGVPRKDFHMNAQHTQWGNKIANLGFKKVGDNPREPLKCWECGEPHLRRNFPCLNLAGRIAFHNLQQASIVGDVGRSMHITHAVVDGRKTDHQSTIMKVEGKIHDNNISILIDRGASFSDITLALVEANKLKRGKHDKPWLVQLETRKKGR